MRKKIGIGILLAVGGWFFGAAFAAPPTLPRGMSCPAMRATPHKLTHIPKLDVPEDKILRRGNEAEPTTLDPSKSSAYQDNNILGDMFDSLYATDKYGKYIPRAASSSGYRKLPNGKYAYYFCLRPAAYWSNGEPVTAHDFVFSFRRLADPMTASAYAYALNPVVNAKAIFAGKKDPKTLGVKAVGNYLFVVTTVYPVPFYKQWLAQSFFAPLYAPVVRKYKDFASNPAHSVTNGAFVLKEWTVNERVTLEKSMTYWDARNVKLAGVIMFPTVNASTAMRSFWGHHLDLITTENISFADVPSILKTPKKKALYHTAPWIGTYWYSVNMAKKPFDDINLRRALFLAIDQRALVKHILHGAVRAAQNLIPPGVSNYNVPQRPAMRLPVASLLECPSGRTIASRAKGGYLYVESLTSAYRKSLALCYYKKAGYSKKHPVKANIYYNTGGSHKVVASVVGSMWYNTLGIKPDLHNQEWKVFIVQRRQIASIGKQSPMDIVRSGWIGDWDDPSTFTDMFLPNTGTNDPGYKSAPFNRLLKKATKTTNLTKRAAVLAKAEQLLLDSYAIEPLYYYSTRFLVHKRVKGFPKQPPVTGRVYDWQLSLED